MPTTDTIRNRVILAQDEAERGARQEQKAGFHQKAACCRTRGRTYEVMLNWIDNGLPLGRADDAPPPWVPFTPEHLDELADRTVCWLRTTFGETLMASYHLGHAVFRTLPEGDYCDQRRVTHIIVLPTPGAPAQFGAAMAARLFQARPGASEVRLDQSALAHLVTAAYEAGSGALPQWMPVTPGLMVVVHDKALKPGTQWYWLVTKGLPGPWRATWSKWEKTWVITAQHTIDPAEVTHVMLAPEPELPA